MSPEDDPMQIPQDAVLLRVFIGSGLVTMEKVKVLHYGAGKTARS
jgi:hypothetical protein